jgi:hypothetical protein
MKNATVLLRTSNELKLTFLLLLVLGVAHAGFGQQNLSFGLGTRDIEIPPPEDPKPAPAPTPAPSIPYTPRDPTPAYDDDSVFWTGFWMFMGGLVFLMVGIPDLPDDHYDSAYDDGGGIGIGFTIVGGSFSLGGLIAMLCDID